MVDSFSVSSSKPCPEVGSRSAEVERLKSGGVNNSRGEEFSFGDFGSSFDDLDNGVRFAKLLWALRRPERPGLALNNSGFLVTSPDEMSRKVGSCNEGDEDGSGVARVGGLRLVIQLGMSASSWESHPESRRRKRLPLHLQVSWHSPA